MGAVKRTHPQARERQQSIKRHKNKQYMSRLNEAYVIIDNFPLSFSITDLIPRSVLDQMMARVEFYILNETGITTPQGLYGRVRHD